MCETKNWETVILFWSYNNLRPFVDMPFTMKIQPIDISQVPVESTKHEPVKPVVLSRLKRLFERQFSGVLRSSAAEKITGGGGGEAHPVKDDSINGSVDLSKMVQSFMEENQEKHSAVSARNRRNCFNGNWSDGSDTESNVLGGFGESTYSSSGESYEILKVGIYMEWEIIW